MRTRRLPELVIAFMVVGSWALFAMMRPAILLSTGYRYAHLRWADKMVFSPSPTNAAAVDLPEFAPLNLRGGAIALCCASSLGLVAAMGCLWRRLLLLNRNLVRDPFVTETNSVTHDRVLFYARRAPAGPPLRTANMAMVLGYISLVFTFASCMCGVRLVSVVISALPLGLGFACLLRGRCEDEQIAEANAAIFLGAVSLIGSSTIWGILG